MQSPPLNPPVDDIAPTANILTGYDETHLVTYLRLLDAEADGELTGKRPQEPSCASIQHANQAGRGAPGRATWLARNG
jgi:hypothetical protein